MHLPTEQTEMGFSLPREAAPIAFPETSVELTRGGREKFHFMYRGQLLSSEWLPGWRKGVRSHSTSIGERAVIDE